MIKKKKILGVVTARSGSKGLKNKNILKFGNKPLLAYPDHRFKKIIDDGLHFSINE